MFEKPLVSALTESIRDVPDFPKPGIVFKDITPMLQDGPLLMRVIDHFKARYAGQGVQRIIGIESRGFIFGAALADRLGVGFVPARKPGKLPAEILREEYELEYGTDRVEIHVDAVKRGEKVVVMDDLLATGGTAAATVELLGRIGAEIVECGFVIELGFLGGRAKLPGVPSYSLITF